MRRKPAWLPATMRNPVAFVLILLIRGYQATLGKILGGSCRFYPSCSEHALQAVRLNGAAIGGAQSVWRVVRCGPWSKGGVDYPKSVRRSRGASAAKRTEATRV